MLIDRGADVNATNEDGNTALIYASKKGHTEIARILIEEGVDVNATDNDGFEALQFALIFEHQEIADLIERVRAK